jgi:hypothetical protein
MVEAFDGHEYELHHEDGRIVFAFRETVVATIASARPEKRLFAERKVPLANPVGKSRKANVQPDYGLWSDAAGAEVCDLIVEVKHYKRDSKKRFREVLIDYAAAHPEGTIVLVNHGPAADMLEGIAAKAASRCRVLGELKPGNTAQREVFRKIVRDHVGEPVVESGLGIAGPGTAILIDISISMGPLLRSEQFASSLAAMARSGAGTVALADTAIRSRCTAAEALAAARSHPGGGSTNLTGPINMLLREFPRVLVLTDNDGLSDIGPFTKDWRCEDGLVQAEILREGSADGGR